MVCIVVGQNEQHLSGFDLVSLICISFNMPFFCSKMSVLIKSSWNKPVCHPSCKIFQKIFPKRIKKKAFGLRRVSSCRLWYYADSTFSFCTLLCVNPLEMKMHRVRIPTLVCINVQIRNIVIQIKTPDCLSPKILQILNYFHKKRVKHLTINIETSCWWPKNRQSILPVWNYELK